MSLNKTPLSINFAGGMDTKSDPFQIPVGKFDNLQNSVFDKAQRLSKRNGFSPLTALPDDDSLFLTTFKGNLTSVGNNLMAYSAATSAWVNKGSLQLTSLETLPLVRSATNQSQADSVVSASGLICTVYTDGTPGGPSYKYSIADSTTSQVISSGLITASSGNINNSPRVFLLGSNFIIAFATSTNHLQYIAISIANPSVITTAADISTSVASSTTVSWDALSLNNNLYFAFNSTAGGQSVKLIYLSAALTLPLTAVVYAGAIATMMSLTADMTSANNPIIYVSYYDLPSLVGKTLAVDKNLNSVLAPTTMISAVSVKNITSTATAGVCTLFYEVANDYGGTIGSVATNFIRSRTITQAGTPGTAATILRSLGIASKAFLLGSVSYLLAAFSSQYQPTYYIIDGSGNIISRLAYSNGGGYLTLGLPNVTLTSTTVQVPYLIKDLIAGINKGPALNSATVPISSVYSQTGVNLVTYKIDDFKATASEIGGTLNISGGYLWSYDGVAPVEQGYHVWPEPIANTVATTGGSITAQQYYYQATYEWADNNGNVIRSAPSLPSAMTASTSSSAATLYVPTLRLTSKANVKIVVYRWSAAQQTYYAISSPASIPTLNDKTVDYVTIVDTASDSQIIGNPILYVTGGVIENTAGPATDNLTLFDNRLWLVDAEDRNLLWFSKQVIEATPVEMSDLLTVYVPPTQGSQGSTGNISAISPMDDKLIIFKKGALGYIAGTGPDNTGANSQYTNFYLINSVIGCENQQSIVLTPNGLMFQSDKGIWMLGRDLSTQYIGAPMEEFTANSLVLSAINVPDTTQVRFTMDSGITIMYDYFYGQWGTFVNIPAKSSAVYNGLHTYLNNFGQVFQESPGIYLDNSKPVLMSFTSSWMNLAGLQGFERFYEALLLGTYISPFKLNVQIAFDYNANPQQSTIVTPDAPSGAFGSLPLWGSGEVWGGPSNVFKARIFPVMQKTDAFQITVTEIYDSSFGISAGAGLTLSGLNLLVGVKKGTRTSSASRSFG